MTLGELTAKWSRLPEKANTHGFKSLLVSPELAANLFIGVDKHANRCLLLSLPALFNAEIRSVQKAYLEIEYYKESRLIVLRLTDKNFSDLFNDFILSVLNKLWSVTDPNQYSRTLVSVFYKWVEFFEDGPSSLLSDDEVKGLFGELCHLRKLIKDSNSQTVNKYLEAWRGPYNHPNDFVLDDKNVEVKTKDFSSLDVKISSEHQLDTEHGKGLELHVISVEANVLNGYSLVNLVSEIKVLIQEKAGEPSLFYKPLAIKGVTFRTMNQYDHLRFLIRKEVTYNCLAQGFPRIIKSGLHPALNRIKYNLRVETLNDFIIFNQTY